GRRYDPRGDAALAPACSELLTRVVNKSCSRQCGCRFRSASRIPRDAASPQGRTPIAMPSRTFPNERGHQMLTSRRRSFVRVRPSPRRRRQLLLDGALQEMESRVLLSITAQVVAGVATFTGDQAADTLYLRANPSNQLEYSTDGVTYSNQLSGTIFTFAQRSQIAANLGGGDDSLALDTTLTGALSKFKATLAYDGGAGSNTLRGSDSASTRDITGVHAGDLENVSFTSVGNLSGGTNQDTFSFSNNAG